ncbi:MAG: rRNA maturation RNase YbeY [Lachnospiraceae bacterium]
MTYYIETEVENRLDFPYEELFSQIVETVLDEEGCPYEATVSLLITDNASIQEINRENRQLDKPTDVLSFPMGEYEIPAEFLKVEEQRDCFEPDTGELLLGDIVISQDQLLAQAKEYGHSAKREFAFLIVHSMLHLIGYDHIEETDRKLMEARQKHLMEVLGIQR